MAARTASSAMIVRFSASGVTAVVHHRRQKQVNTLQSSIQEQYRDVADQGPDSKVQKHGRTEHHRDRNAFCRLCSTHRSTSPHIDGLPRKALREDSHEAGKQHWTRSRSIRRRCNGVRVEHGRTRSTGRDIQRKQPWSALKRSIQDAHSNRLRR